MRANPTVTGTVIKTGVNTGSTYGSGPATAAALMGSGPYVRVTASGGTATDQPASGKIAGGLDAEFDI